MEKDTICAISTPIGTGGISIVRLSGSSAKNIAFKIFSCKACDEATINPRYFYLGNITEGDIKEKCMIVYFKAPHSYTGEDLIELQCHGGVLVTRKILELLLAHGARIAEPGEFTKRAFVNGKMSLDEAEGVIDVINAESESELKAAYSIASGNLHSAVTDFQTTITDLISKINVSFDFPENDDEDITSAQVLGELKNMREKLNSIIATCDTGIKLKEGNRVCIVGRPNVGKSSIMNAMLGVERAIVTNIQGTTRDVLEETYIFNGVRFVLSDTAGLRSTDDVIENIGIKKAKESLNNADIVLFVLDGSESLSEYDLDIISQLHDKNVLVVVNKSDLTQKLDIKQIPFENILFCSAINKSNIERIKQKIFDLVIDKKILKENLIITNVRHKERLEKSRDIINTCICDLESSKNLDLISLQLQDAWETLGEITGVTKTEEIIANIFSKFCVGK